MTTWCIYHIQAGVVQDIFAEPFTERPLEHHFSTHFHAAIRWINNHELMIVTGHRHDKQSYCISPRDYYHLGLFSSALEPLSVRVVYEEIALLLIALQSKSWVGAACSVHKDLVEWHAILEPLRDLQG